MTHHGSKWPGGAIGSVPLFNPANVAHVEQGNAVGRPIPAGFRPMTPDEGDQLDAYASVLVFDRALNRIIVFRSVNYTQHHGWRLAQWDGTQYVNAITLDDDSPEFWSEADEQSGRDRRSPQSVDGNFIGVLPDDPTDLMPLLRQSIYATEAVDILAELRLVNEAADRERAQRHLRILDEEAEKFDAMVVENVRPVITLAQVQKAVMAVVPGCVLGDGKVLERSRRIC